ncbi:hypothetical protein U1Q18_003411 [Sarracenia purpurea var. burkii]
MTVDQPVGFRSSRGRSEVLPVKARLASLAKRIQFLKWLSPLKPKPEWLIAASLEAHIVKDTEDEVDAYDSEDSKGVEAVDAVEDDAIEADLGEVEAKHEQGISSSHLGQVISKPPVQDCGMDFDLKREPVVAIKGNQFDKRGGLSKVAHQVFDFRPKVASEISFGSLDAPTNMAIGAQMLGDNFSVCPNTGMPPVGLDQQLVDKGLEPKPHPACCVSKEQDLDPSSSKGGNRSWVDVIGNSEDYWGMPLPILNSSLSGPCVSGVQQYVRAPARPVAQNCSFWHVSQLANLVPDVVFYQCWKQRS